MIGRLNDIFERLRGGGADGISRAAGAFEPVDVGELTVRCDTEWPAIDEAWDALWARVPGATVFQGPAWQGAAWRTLPGAKQLRLITVHRGEQLVAVLPLHLTSKGGLITPGAAVSDYLDPLIDPEEEPTVWGAVLGFLSGVWDRNVVELTLHNVREGASCRTVLPGAAERRGFSYEERIVEYAPAVKLATTWEAFLDGLDPHERKELRRKVNKAEQKGAATLTRCAADETGAALATALRLMQACGGEKGEAVAKYLRPLLEEAAPSLIAQGRMEIWMLRVRGEVASCLLQLPHAEGPMLYNCGYEPGMREWSPGVVAVAMAMRMAIDSGARVYDLLRGQEGYKYRLGAVDRALVRVTLKRKPS